MPRTSSGLKLEAGIQSLERGLLVLEYLCSARDSVRLVDIAQNLNQNTATIFRILSTLSVMGYVEQDPITEQYRPTLRILSLGNAVLSRVNVGSAARPYIVELSNKSGESVHLSIRNAFNVVIIDKVEADASNRVAFHIGRTNSCYSTGTGKVLLAYMDPDEMEYFFETEKLQAYTVNTLTDHAALRKELEDIREKGYAVDRQENRMGFSCVAAPIWDFSGKVVAGVSVTGPNFRIERNIPFLSTLVREAAAKISRSLGYVAESPLRTGIEMPAQQELVCS